MIQSFRDLQVWQKGMNLVVSVYRMRKVPSSGNVWFDRSGSESRGIDPLECR